MRQVLLGFVGAVAASSACDESYSFSAVIQGASQERTSIECDGPKLSRRVPTGCILSERAIAYPNHQRDRHSSGVACAAGYSIVFHPNVTLAECVLDAVQPEAVSDFTFKVPLGDCKGRVRFDKTGRVDC
ncbi:hypothetical protein KHP60_20010 [Microvirga sp. 3-52]|uniref:hypothetical protein n=1 Tax=Microvirga sp. 3-52 TaxID=2792425 RepID=UPI001ACFFB58|nr:hypothetical protein [Microvirga sp. 3-52]MBO1908168.1 hypothetical protein [Microvirga sp. 3-52]MBS7454605.1 hypothetical protein [Microvirga sp. 3-52]